MVTPKELTSLSKDAATQTDNNVIHDLLTANSRLTERARKAEETFLKMQLQMELDKLQVEKSAKEQDIMSRLKLYASTDQEHQIRREFQSYLEGFHHKETNLQVIHKLFGEALTNGLVLDDLPDHHSSVEVVQAELKLKLLKKKSSGQQGSGIASSNYLNQFQSDGGVQTFTEYAHQNLITQAGTVPTAVRPVYLPRAPTPQSSHMQLPLRADHYLVNNGNYSTIQTTPSTVPATMPAVFEYGHTSLSHTSLSQLSNKDVQSVSNGHTQNSFNRPPPAAAVAEPVVLNVRAATPNQLNSKVERQTEMRSQPSEQLVSTKAPAEKTSPEAPTTVAATDSHPAGIISTDNVAELDAFDDMDIDDDMFQDEETDEATTSQGATATSGITNTVDIDDNSSDSASVDDDEEFAKSMVTLQSKGDGGLGAKPKVPSPVPKKVLEDIDWKGHLSEVVHNLATRCKIPKKVAEQYLDEAYRKVGSIDDLGQVYKEAMKSADYARLPFTAAPPVTNTTSATTKLQASASATTNAMAGSYAATMAQRTGSATSVTQQPTTKPGFSTYKTSLCRNWLATKKCPHGEYCLFAHGKGELRTTTVNTGEAKTFTPNSYYKVILCRNFKADGECKWGDNCIFAHGEEELRTSTESATDSSSKLLTANDGEEEDETHPEPCDNQQCPARLNFLLRKTSLCQPYQKYNNCRYNKDCKFAHGEKELVKMPKWEMCERHLQGRCMHSDNPSKCVYAHSEKERRPKPASVSALQRKNALAISRGIIPTRPATTSTATTRPMSYSASTASAWGKDDAGTGQRYEDECLICMGRLEERPKLLKCGHDSFHAKCISQWVNEGLPHCPVCRAPAKLPDLYNAPAGFKPKDFPGLGL